MTSPTELKALALKIVSRPGPQTDEIVLARGAVSFVDELEAARKLADAVASELALSNCWRSWGEVREAKAAYDAVRGKNT